MPVHTVRPAAANKACTVPISGRRCGCRNPRLPPLADTTVSQIQEFWISWAIAPGGGRTFGFQRAASPKRRPENIYTTYGTVCQTILTNRKPDLKGINTFEFKDPPGERTWSRRSHADDD